AQSIEQVSGCLVGRSFTSSISFGVLSGDCGSGLPGLPFAPVLGIDIINVNNDAVDGSLLCLRQLVDSGAWVDFSSRAPVMHPEIRTNANFGSPGNNAVVAIHTYDVARWRPGSLDS